MPVEAKYSRVQEDQEGFRIKNQIISQIREHDDFPKMRMRVCQHPEKFEKRWGVGVKTQKFRDKEIIFFLTWYGLYHAPVVSDGFGNMPDFTKMRLTPDRYYSRYREDIYNATSKLSRS